MPLAMIVAVFTNVRGTACFQIFTPRNPTPGARKSAAKELINNIDFAAAGDLCGQPMIDKLEAKVDVWQQPETHTADVADIQAQSVEGAPSSCGRHSSAAAEVQ